MTRPIRPYTYPSDRACYVAAADALREAFARMGQGNVSVVLNPVKPGLLVFLRVPDPRSETWHRVPIGGTALASLLAELLDTRPRPSRRREIELDSN